MYIKSKKAAATARKTAYSRNNFEKMMNKMFIEPMKLSISLKMNYNDYFDAVAVGKALKLNWYSFDYRVPKKIEERIAKFDFFNRTVIDLDVMLAIAFVSNPRRVYDAVQKFDDSSLTYNEEFRKRVKSAIKLGLELLQYSKPYMIDLKIEVA